MHIDLSGKTAIVTGSTRGIGLATARGLAEAGATVVITGRNSDDVAVAMSQIAAGLPEATLDGVAADLSTAEGCERITSAFPAVDILVNNAGIFGEQDFFETPDADWRKFWDVDVMSGVRLSRHYLPGMEKNGWGRVVFIASESAINIPADMIHYGVMKTAYLSLSRGLAKRMRKTGVTVNAVLPGPTLSEGMIDGLKKTAEQKGESIEQAGIDFVAENRPSSILMRPTTTDEVANMIVYVCSPQASGTTGASLRVDGGVVDTI
jgi:NAD(P)-dependent dehydrogenase (short-subunit alcohol dehydrogenase family)